MVYGAAMANPDSEAAVMNVVYESYYTDKEKNKNYGQDEFKIFIYLVNKEVIELMVMKVLVMENTAQDFGFQ